MCQASPNNTQVPKHSKNEGPFVHVPEDVVLRIFAIAVAEENADGGTKYFFGSVPQLALPIRLSHVSSRERTIVLAAPSLWNTINDDSLHSLPIMTAFLSRSKTAPLDITVNITEKYVNDKRFEQLVAHITRWKRLSITSYYGTSDVFEPIIQLLRTLCVPQLIHLSIVAYLEYNYSNVNPKVLIKPIFSKGTPVLTSLGLTTSYFLLPPDLGKLTQLSLSTEYGESSPLSYDKFCTVLKAMPLLEHLQLSGAMAGDWPPVKAAKPITSPRLTSISVESAEDFDENGSHQYHFLASLLVTIPTDALRSLELKNLAPDMLSLFLDSLRQRAFRFRKVSSLRWCSEIEEEDVPVLTDGFPALKTFTLSGSDSFSILEALVVDDDASPTDLPWPELSHLDLRAALSHVNLPLLREVVSSRINIGLPIREISLLRLDPGFGEYVEWLAEHVNLRVPQSTIHETMQGSVHKNMAASSSLLARDIFGWSDSEDDD